MSARKILIGIAVVLIVIIGVLALLVLGVVAYVAFSDRTNGVLVSAGQERQYLVYVPPSYDRAKPTPLVISMHGAVVWPAHEMETSRWNRVADEHGFIVVYPAGSGRPRIWHLDRGPGLMRDVKFISELIDTLAASYNIDRTRIYADGLSNGGGMAFVLSCTLADRIAAIGMVAAARSLPWTWCTDSRPVPMIAFHGTADRMVPYNGGPTPVGPDIFPSVLGFTADWARRNRCGRDPTESTVAADVTRLEYTHCADDAPVVLYTVRGGGHTWPGGKPMPEWFAGPTSSSIDATNQMWTFFQEHPLRK